MTRTFVLLEISQLAYDEIKGRILAAGNPGDYADLFGRGGEIDMHGIALVVENGLDKAEPSEAMMKAAHFGPNCAEEDMTDKDREFYREIWQAMAGVRNEGR